MSRHEPISGRDVVRINAGVREAARDALTVEEPCEIRLDGEAVAVTMRTPGNDPELAAGFLFTEGIIAPGDLATVTHCIEPDSLHAENVVEARLAPHCKPRREWQRNFYTTSSCGICGKASIEMIHVHAGPVGAGPELEAATLASMIERLGVDQRVFRATGGLHAAGLFAAGGELQVVREDVGRHNAVDKVIGHAFLEERVPLTGRVLVVSGRTSFEIVQKALVAGISIVAGVSAASSLAVDLAADSNMTLVGFLRGQSMNVYTGAERIV